MAGDSALPDELTVRPATDADLDAVVCLIDDADRAIGLDPDPIRDYLTWIWHVPSTDLGRDTRLVASGKALACFGQAIWSPEEGGPLTTLIRVHPDHLGLGLGSSALAWAEALAAERGSEGTRARAPDADDLGRSLLVSRGYVRVRSSWTMGRRLEPREDPGRAPTGVRIRAFETGRDERALHEVYEASFADHWGFRSIPYGKFEADMYGADDWDPSLAYLAEVEGRVAGHVVAISFEGDASVAILGVEPQSRGRGIAKALLRRVFAELATRGHDEVRLMVDAQNPTGALALYESVGMTTHRAYDIFDLGTPDAERLNADRR